MAGIAYTVMPVATSLEVVRSFKSRLSTRNLFINNEHSKIITRVAAHCHTRQHSEYDKEMTTSIMWRTPVMKQLTLRVVSYCGKTQRLVFRRNAETESY